MTIMIMIVMMIMIFFTDVSEKHDYIKELISTTKSTLQTEIADSCATVKVSQTSCCFDFLICSDSIKESLFYNPRIFFPLRNIVEATLRTLITTSWSSRRLCR